MKKDHPDNNIGISFCNDDKSYSSVISGLSEVTSMGRKQALIDNLRDFFIEDVEDIFIASNNMIKIRKKKYLRKYTASTFR